MTYVVGNDEVVDHLRRHTEARKAAATWAVSQATGQDVEGSEGGDSPAGG